MSNVIKGQLTSKADSNWRVCLIPSGLLVLGIEPYNKKMDLKVGDIVFLTDMAISWQSKRFTISEKVEN